MKVFSFRITTFKFNPTENDGLCCFPTTYIKFFVIFYNTITSNWTHSREIDKWYVRQFGSKLFGGGGCGGGVCVCLGVCVWVCVCVNPSWHMNF